MTKTLLSVLLCGSCVVGAQSPLPVPPSAAHTRSAFMKVIDRPRVPLAPVVRALPSPSHGVVQEHITFAADAKEQVTAILVKSSDNAGRRPVVIQLHGTGGNKEQLVPRLTTLAGRGFIAIAIDGRYHGERAKRTTGLANPYGNAIFNAFQTGEEHPFFYDTVWDVMRLIDYLETRADVDATRIGLGGFSKGGIETYLTAALEPRVVAAVAAHGVQSFKWALDHGGWDSRAWTIRDALEAAAEKTSTTVTAQFVRTFYDRVAPGIYGDFDGPAMLPLIAPRPLLVVTGDSDPRTPLSGVKECAAAAERAYKAAGVPDKFSLMIEPNTGHEQTPAYDEAMVAWFVRWLKP
jgi:dienelactone hydrolase